MIVVKGLIPMKVEYLRHIKVKDFSFYQPNYSNKF